MDVVVIFEDFGGLVGGLFWLLLVFVELCYVVIVCIFVDCCCMEVGDIVFFGGGDFVLVSWGFVVGVDFDDGVMLFGVVLFVDVVLLLWGMIGDDWYW